MQITIQDEAWDGNLDSFHDVDAEESAVSQTMGSKGDGLDGTHLADLEDSCLAGKLDVFGAYGGDGFLDSKDGTEAQRLHEDDVWSVVSDEAWGAGCFLGRGGDVVPNFGGSNGACDTGTAQCADEHDEEYLRKEDIEEICERTQHLRGAIRDLQLLAGMSVTPMGNLEEISDGMAWALYDSLMVRVERGF